MTHHTVPFAPTRRSLLAVVAALCPAAVLSPVAARADSASVGRSTVAYQVPPVTLIDAAGKPVALQTLMGGKRPVILEFFYTSCTTICGLQSSALANAQSVLDNDCTMVSISIDPEFDTPARLRDYATSFAAKPNWHLLTGRRQDIRRVLTAFDARPLGDNKMFHQPYVFIRVAPDRLWLRLEGLMDGAQLVREFREATAHPPPRLGVRTAGLLSSLHWPSL